MSPNPRSPDHASAVGRTAPRRITALDFTKGTLVLFMVLYHWLNYFTGLHGVIYRYLRFLPPSFIFISGFLISNAYLSKYDIADSKLPRRLTARGLKILGVFALLNVAISLLFTHFKYWEPSNLLAIIVTGKVLIAGVGKAAAFYILVPIGYLLLLSASLVLMCRFYRYSFHLVCALCFIAIFVLHFFGLESPNLELLTVGLLGLILGYSRIEKINAFVRHPYALIAAYLAYTLFITWREPNYPLQVVGVCLTLMLLYLVGLSSNGPGIVRNQVILLGKYSLYGYIGQVAILQVMRRLLMHVNLGAALLTLSFIAALALTVISVDLVDGARLRSPAADRLYKSIFA